MYPPVHSDIFVMGADCHGMQWRPFECCFKTHVNVHKKPLYQQHSKGFITAVMRGPGHHFLYQLRGQGYDFVFKEIPDAQGSGDQSDKTHRGVASGAAKDLRTKDSFHQLGPGVMP